MLNRISIFFACFIVIFAAAVSFSQKPIERKVINLPERQPELPFSDSILIGDTLYLAGKIGIDPKTGKAPEKVEDEIRLVMDRVKQNLEAAGMTMDDLVSVQVFCSDISL